MKKLFALLLTLALLCPAALATEITDSGVRQADTVISTRVAQSYTVIIPAEVVIPFEQEETPLTVQVLELHLSVPEDTAKVSQLSVAVQPESGMLRNSGDETLTIPYTIAAAGGQNGTLLFDAVGDKDMTVRITEDAWNQAAAGDYADTVTFTITIQTLDR